MVATGLVAVLAIIPQGMNIVRDAVDTSTEARIAQYVFGEITVTDWKEVEKFNHQRLYFDAEGIELGVPEQGSPPADAYQVTYIARIEIGAPLGVLPAAAESGGFDRDLLRVQVHLIDTPQFDFDFADPKRFRTYSTVIARAAR